MKFLVSQLMHFVHDSSTRAKFGVLLRFVLILALLVTAYSVLFHYIMAYEGRYESWLTGFYWTLVTMSTLGFGDITFESDLGRLFSMVVLLSGIIFLLVLLPFTFIEFFYAPWMQAQAAARAPSALPKETKGHVILIQHDAVTDALIKKLRHYHYPYVLLMQELQEALKFHDLGYRVVLGDLDSPETYRRLNVENALLVVATANDRVNTNVAFTVREVSEKVSVITTANSPASVDILELAGSSHVLQLGEMMGQALARRVLGGDTMAHIVGQFDDLLIAEATVRNTPLIGKSLRESNLREKAGITVLGVWERGVFRVAGAETSITPNTVLMLAGSRQQMQRYNELLCTEPPSIHPVVIIGGGRVGRAAGNALAERGMDYRIVELAKERIRNAEKYVHGDAAELEVLERAGIRSAPAVLVTTHDDDTNIYLTIYCRRLRPDVQIISRAKLERNIDTLHRAGADFIMSYATMGSTAIINLLSRSNILMIAEGLDLFEVTVPPSLAGRSLIQSDIRRRTGCTVVAIRDGAGIQTTPDPHRPLPANANMLLIGTPTAEESFLKRYMRV
jgi:voltage-gated potassium channel